MNPFRDTFLNGIIHVDYPRSGERLAFVWRVKDTVDGTQNLRVLPFCTCLFLVNISYYKKDGSYED
jgi:hypothetical protein